MRVAFEYGVFLGCSERDRAWAHWLQQVIEAWRADPDMVGRLTPAGRVPSSLRPVFRDDGGPALTSAAVAALEASRSLVVLCTPRSTPRPALDEALRRFAWLGRGERIVPVIMAGAPPACLPPALRPPEELAAIPRLEVLPGGKARAAHRLVARLTGLDADEMAQRATGARQRRHDRRRTAAAALIALALAGEGALALGRLALAGDDAWLEAALRQGTQLTGRGVALAQELGLPEGVITSLLAAAEDRLRALAALGSDPARRDRRTATLLIDLAPRFAGLGARPASAARLQEAERLLRPLAALDASHGGADALLAAAVQRHDPGMARQRARLLAHEAAGEASHARGDPAGALREYEAAHRILARLAGDGDPAADMELGAMHARIAAVHEARGDLRAALASYEACREVGVRLAAQATDEPGWRRDLAVTHGKVAAIRHRLGHTALALAELRKGREIMAALIEAEPDFTPWSTDLARIEERIAALEGRASQPPAMTAAHGTGAKERALR